MRSTATVPRAALMLTPRSRVARSRVTKYGRTNSPSRTGSARIAMKPTDEMSTMRLNGSDTPMGRSRNSQRHERNRCVTASVST